MTKKPHKISKALQKISIIKKNQA